jgi:RND family efflux transporter MFP subunit
MKKIIYLLTTGMILLILSCSSKKEEPQEQNEAALEVVLASPSSLNNNELHFSGQIEAAQSAQISTRVMGFITAIHVKLGDAVQKGQLLVSIQHEELKAKRAQTEAMIAEAESAYNNAKKDLERFTNLYKQQSASPKELDNINLQFNSAKSRLEAARQMRNEVNAMMDYTQLRAPFSGIVSQKLMDVGTMANPGMPILTVEQSGAMQLSASIPENNISQIQKGMPAIIKIQSAEKTIQTVISEIQPSSQFTGGQYIVKAKIPTVAQKGIYSGMYATLSVATKSSIKNPDTDAAIIVPLSAIETKNQLSGLYTVSSNNHALLRWVRLGKTVGTDVEVLSGLEQNEKYIAQASGKLYNGALVKIK